MFNLVVTAGLISSQMEQNKASLNLSMGTPSSVVTTGQSNIVQISSSTSSLQHMGSILRGSGSGHHTTFAAHMPRGV